MSESNNSLDEPLVEDAEQPGEAEVEVDVKEADVKQLAEMTGCSADACHAALLQHGGSLEEAAVQLLEQPQEAEPERPRTSARPREEPAAEPINEEAEAQGAVYLAEATGRQLSECRTALRAHGGSIDQAAATLLSLPPAQASSAGSSAGPPAAPEEGGASSPDEARQAAMISEATGRALPACVAALRSCGGRPEDAVMALLGEVPAAVPSTASGSGANSAVASVAAALADPGDAAAGAPLGAAEVGLDFEDPLGLDHSPNGLQPVGNPDSPLFRAPADEADELAAELGLASPSPPRCDPGAETDPEAEVPPTAKRPIGDPDAETDPEAEAPPPAKRPRQDNGENPSLDENLKYLSAEEE